MYKKQKTKKNKTKNLFFLYKKKKKVTNLGFSFWVFGSFLYLFFLTYIFHFINGHFCKSDVPGQFRT